MPKQNRLHVVEFRDRERSWNDRALDPIAIFIGYSPGSTYFRCFDFHAKQGVDCRYLSGTGFGSIVLDVIARSGYGLTGVTKKERIESFSQRFCLVDFFESDSHIKPAMQKVKRGILKVDTVVEPAAMSVKLVARRCRAQGRVLPIIAALAGFAKPENPSGPETMREFRWLLWEALRRNVEAKYKDNVKFNGWIDAHLFGMQKGDAGSKARWESRVHRILSEALIEDRKIHSDGRNY